MPDIPSHKTGPASIKDIVSRLDARVARDRTRSEQASLLALAETHAKALARRRGLGIPPGTEIHEMGSATARECWKDTCQAIMVLYGRDAELARVRARVEKVATEIEAGIRSGARPRRRDPESVTSP